MKGICLFGLVIPWNTMRTLCLYGGDCDILHWIRGESSWGYINKYGFPLNHVDAF